MAINRANPDHIGLLTSSLGQIKKYLMFILEDTFITQFTRQLLRMFVLMESQITEFGSPGVIN